MGSRKERNITRFHLADAVCRASGLPRSDASPLVALFFDLIGETLMRGEPVLLSGFGKFVIVPRAARKARNVRMGHDVMIGPRLALVFKPAIGLVQLLSDGLANGADSRAAAPDRDGVLVDLSQSAG